VQAGAGAAGEDQAFAFHAFVPLRLIADPFT
jgi:hypothetical protein